MNWYDLGRAAAGQMFTLVVIAGLVGATVAIGGYFAFVWVVTHVTISIS